MFAVACGLSTGVTSNIAYSLVRSNQTLIFAAFKRKQHPTTNRPCLPRPRSSKTATSSPLSPSHLRKSIARIAFRITRLPELRRALLKLYIVDITVVGITGFLSFKAVAGSGLARRREHSVSSPFSEEPGIASIRRQVEEFWGGGLLAL